MIDLRLLAASDNPRRQVFVSVYVRLATVSIPAALLFLAGCASVPPPEVDLAPARTAVTQARAKAATDEAKDCLARAEEDLKGAEALATSPSPAERQRAAGLASAAAVSAVCVDRLEAQGRRLSAPAESPSGNGRDEESERLKARLRKSAQEQKRLEERLAVLQHDLETTENEVIRTKAKLKGIETKAEASSAIAEAQTLVVRNLDEKVRSPNLTRAQEKIGLAERQLREGNYGAAVFFALQAQDILGHAPKSRALAPGKTPAPRVVTVTVHEANVRSEPRAGAPVVGKVPRGTTVTPIAEEGDWLRIESGGAPGWIAKSVVR